jgi:hypothetical protein
MLISFVLVEDHFVLQEKLYDFFKELQTLKKAYIIA